MKTLAFAFFGLVLAVTAGGCCCGGCGSQFGAGYSPGCSPCQSTPSCCPSGPGYGTPTYGAPTYGTPTYGAPIQGTYNLTPTATQSASAFPAVTTASAIPLESLPTY